jgi:ceramide glucosyltransferase
VLWYWFASAPVALLSIAGLFSQRMRARYIAEQLRKPGGWTPPVTLIVPVKGEDEGLRENLAALAGLDYPDYEMLIVAQGAKDIPPGVLPRRVKVVLAGAGDLESGEKVRNLQAAVRAARKRSEVFAFADSDGRPPRGWLRALVAPLETKGVGAATGYRWFMPQPATFWGLMCSVWNSISGGMLGPGDNPFAWGGAMAIRKETFFETRVPEFWKGTVSDDYALSAAVHRAGLSIAYAPGALTPSFDRPRCLAFFAWIARQMTITRFYHPRLWWTGFVAHIYYCGIMAASIAVWSAGYWPAALVLGLQTGCGMAMGWRRATLARLSMPDYREWFRINGWAHAALVPLATWVWLISFLASAWSDEIEWRGRVYRLKKGSHASGA